MHTGYAPLFQNPGNRLPDLDAYRNELRLAGARRAARVRFGLVGRAPLHRLHDVPRRRAVPHLDGGEDRADRPRLDGGRAAVARPHPGRGADRDARPDLRRTGDPRDRARPRPGGVRRLPRRHGRVARALRRDRAARARSARERVDGRGRRVRGPASAEPSARPRSGRSGGAHVRGRGVAGIDAGDGEAGRGPCSWFPRSRGRTCARTSRSTGGCSARRTAPRRRRRSARGSGSWTRARTGRRRWRVDTSPATTTR